MNVAFPADSVAPANITNAPMKAPRDNQEIIAQTQAALAALKQQQAALLQQLIQNAVQIMDTLEAANYKIGFSMKRDLAAAAVETAGISLIDMAALENLNGEWEDQCFDMAAETERFNLL
jgi:hypothetical protein